MNDFTKDELILIRALVRDWQDNAHNKLINKIQSMIDNHFEHDDEI